MPTIPRRHLLAAALVVIALLATPATSMAAVVGWGSQPALGLGGDPTPVPALTLPGAQEATAAAVGPEASYLLTGKGVLSSSAANGGGFALIPGTSGAKAVATGAATLIVGADGTVDGFGPNEFGEAGGTAGTPIKSPTPIAGLADVTAVAAGASNSLALKSDGTVWAWGNHAYLGSTAGAAGSDTGTPTQVTLPDGNPATAISAGDGHFLVLLQDGSVWAWGSNASGQVGNGGGADVTVPVQVIPPAAPGDLTVTSISAGTQTSFALYSDGTFKAWGAGYYGQLALGLAYEDEEFVTVPTSPDPAVVAAHPAAYPPLSKIVAVGSSTYGIVADGGQVLVWGYSGGSLFAFGQNPPAFDYAFPYDPANPDTPGTSGQGAAEIPQRLARLRQVPWLGVGALGGSEIASTRPYLYAVLQASNPQFYSQPVGTLSGPHNEVFYSEDEATRLTSIRITGPDAEDFTVDTVAGIGGSFPVDVPGGYFGVFVRFHPSGLGDRTATLELSGQGETVSMSLGGFGTDLPGNTPGPAGKDGVVGIAGPPGPTGPAGKDGVVVFAAGRARVSAQRGSTTSLPFLLVNGTTAKLVGASLSAEVPKALGTSTARASSLSALNPGASRHLSVPLQIGKQAPLGSKRVRVSLQVGGKTVTRTVTVRVKG